MNTDDSPVAFVATINVPGYLPMDDEPTTFDTAVEAWAWLADRRTDEEDELPGDCSQTHEILGVLATTQHWDHPEVADWLADNGIAPDGTGTVYGDTPGGALHDLGMAYSVHRGAGRRDRMSTLEGCPGCGTIEVPMWMPNKRRQCTSCHTTWALDEPATVLMPLEPGVSAEWVSGLLGWRRSGPPPADSFLPELPDLSPRQWFTLGWRAAARLNHPDDADLERLWPPDRPTPRARAFHLSD